MIAHQDATVTIHHGDALDVLRDLPDASVDAVVTDPPYGLEFMGKEWDAFGGDSRQPHRGEIQTPDNPFGRSTVRFAGSASYGGKHAAAMRAFGAWCEQWAAECLRVLKPGGHMLAFGGTRTWHRLACAVEDAGFEVRDSIAWLYGSGFPKSLDVSKAIDKRPGVSRHPEFVAHLIERREAAGLSRADVSEWVVGTRSGACWNWEHHQFPEAKWWPALRDLLAMDEGTWGPIIAEAERQKIGERTTGIGTGRGSVAIMGDGNRDVTSSATDDARTWQGWGTALKPAFEPIVVARKPLTGTVAANVLRHGTGALNIDACRIGTDDRVQASASGGVPFGDGNYAEGDGRRYSTTAGRWPANVVLDESQAAELDAMSGTLTSGAWTGKRNKPKFGDQYGEFAGREEAETPRDADSGGASRFFYTAKAGSDERVRLNGIAHPTVKPLALMRWLVRLVCPPGGVCLDPFAGSGTTVEACILEGFRCIAIEREADYLPLIMQRINRRRNPVEAVKATGDDGGLFDLLDGGASA